MTRGESRAVVIRPVRDRELDLLQAIEVAAGAMFRDVGMPEIAEHAPPSVDELAVAAAVLVAVDDVDVPVGYAWLEVVDGHAHLEQVSVLPSHGRRGVGSALLDAAADWARRRGDTEITLTAFRDVPFNAPLYRRRGYEEIADRDRGPELISLMASEAAHGLDPAQRVAMRHCL